MYIINKYMSCLNEQEFNTVENMSKYGGSFIKALAECFHHADVHNKRLLITTFPTYWEQYSPDKRNDNMEEQAS